MSSNSVTSSKRELQTKDLMQELDSIRAMNSSLRVYLGQIRTFKKNLEAVDENYKQLSNVNTKWVDMLNMLK